MVKRKYGRRYRGKIGQKGRAIAMRNGRMSGSMFKIGRYMRYKNPTHFFKRTCNLAGLSNVAFNGALSAFSTSGWQLISNTAGLVNYGSYGVNFTLNMLPDYTEFSVLFDRYKIVGAKMKLIMYQNGALTGAAAVASYPQSGVLWHGITDYDDSAAPTAAETGIDTLREYESYKTCNAFNKGVIGQYCRPRLALSAYGGAFTRYANAGPMWIDCNSVDTQHYGFKGIFEISPCASITSTMLAFIKPEITLYFQLKDLR